MVKFKTHKKQLKKWSAMNGTFGTSTNREKIKNDAPIISDRGQESVQQK